MGDFLFIFYFILFYSIFLSLFKNFLVIWWMVDGGGEVSNLVYWCAGYEGSEKKNNDEKMREKKISRPGRRGMEEV